MLQARRNLDEPAQRQRLDRLMRSLRVVPEAPDRLLPRSVDLPKKDRPILQAALAAGATRVLTGDLTHFGPLLDRTVAGLRIQTPGECLRERDRRGR